MPTVFSNSSMPVYFDRFHSPCRSAACAGLTWRAAASIRATASSAAETMLEVGALTTITPDWVAARTSTLSSPTPARATTLSRLATASASASTAVALRTSSASASGSAASSSARSAPLQCRISKSGPSSSIVAGLSSSAIRTTGLPAWGAVPVGAPDGALVAAPVGASVTAVLAVVNGGARRCATAHTTPRADR